VSITDESNGELFDHISRLKSSSRLKQCLEFRKITLYLDSFVLSINNVRIIIKEQEQDAENRELIELAITLAYVHHIANTSFRVGHVIESRARLIIGCCDAATCCKRTFNYKPVTYWRSLGRPDDVTLHVDHVWTKREGRTANRERGEGKVDVHQVISSRFAHPPE